MAVRAGALRRRALPLRLCADGRGGRGLREGFGLSDTRMYVHKWDMLSDEAVFAWVVHLGIC